MNRSVGPIKVGLRHPYAFPKMKGFLSPLKIQETVAQLREESNDHMWNVTEKLDGCNVCISSQDWIASRQVIIGKCTDETLTARVWNKASLKKVPKIYGQALELKTMLKPLFKDDEDFDVMLYGELILPGTSTTHLDEYNYGGRQINSGDILVFAMGLVFYNDWADKESLPKMPVYLEHGFYVEADGDTVLNPYFLVPMNTHLSTIFSANCVKHIPPIYVNRLSRLLNKGDLVFILMNKLREGFVFSSNNGQGYIKWKYNTSNKPNDLLFATANELIHSQKSNSENRSAALNIKNVYQEGLSFINDKKDIDYKALFKAFLDENKIDLEQRLKHACQEGFIWLDMVVDDLEDKLFRLLVLPPRDYKLSPHVRLQIRGELRNFIMNWSKLFETMYWSNVN